VDLIIDDQDADHNGARYGPDGSPAATFPYEDHKCLCADIGCISIKDAGRPNLGVLRTRCRTCLRPAGAHRLNVLRTMPAQRVAPGDLSHALTAAFPWFRPTVGIGLVDGVGEIDATAAFDIYAGNSSAARAVPVAAEDTITTRHGLQLIAQAAGAGAPRVPFRYTGWQRRIAWPRNPA
jgi:hypothetical protein